MPNWCANRLMFSGIQNSYALKTWIAGGEQSLHRRARKEGIQLFQAGCAGISTARSQCAAPGRTRDGRFFRSCPASL